PFDQGRQVRERGDPPRPPGEAWRAIDQTGHRHRPVEGAAKGSEAAPAEEGTDVGGDAAQGAAGFVARPPAPAAIVAPEERDPASAAARIEIGGFAGRVVGPGAR